MPTPSSRELALALFEAAGRECGRAVDAAETAQALGISPVEAGFTVLLLEENGILRRASPQGETMEVFVTPEGAAYLRRVV